ADGTARIWDPNNGTLILVLKGHRGGIRSLAFTSDARRLVSAGNDGTLRLWDTGSGQEVLSLKLQDNYADAVAFSPDGSLVAAPSGAVVQIWDSRRFTHELHARRRAVDPEP